MDDRQKVIRKRQAWEGILADLPSLGVPDERIEDVRAAGRDGRFRGANDVTEMEELRGVIGEAASAAMQQKSSGGSSKSSDGPPAKRKKKSEGGGDG